MIAAGGLTTFLWKSNQRDAILMVAASVVAILLQAGALREITGIAADPSGWGDGPWAALFTTLLMIKLSALGKSAALFLAVRAAERGCGAITSELAARVARSELTDIEGIGREELFGRLGADARTVATASWTLIPALQSSLLICACLIFMILAAPVTTIVVALLAVLGAWLVRRVSRRFDAATDVAIAAEDLFLGRVDDLFRGFAELRTSREKMGDFKRAALGPAARHARRTRRYSVKFLVAQTFTIDTMLYGILGVVAFAAPADDSPRHVAMALATLIYLVDRIDYLDVDLPIVHQGEAAFRRIEALLRRLPDRDPDHGSVAGGDDAPVRPAPAEFRTISLSGVTHRYRGADGDETGWFALGPIDLTFEHPEICLVVGGNGSGKSTLMKLLTGLYLPDDGSIFVDERRLPVNTYREMFSAVFTDYHLFETLHGIDAEPAEVADLLHRLGLDQVVRFEDGRFSSRDLSTGQRKRLALVVAWLERRPVMVFDEWTADQDPEFRIEFFQRLLPELKARGTTVIAVTHDDRHFHLGDRVIRMDAGRIVSDARRPTSDAPHAARPHAPGEDASR